MKRQRMLYIMGIDWQWIYQRPQILAEKLAQDYEVVVVFPRSIVSKDKKIPNVQGIEFRILWTIPFQEKNSLVGSLASCKSKKIFSDIHTFDYIFVGYPQYGRYIPEDYKGKIIYDCMDNFEALYPDQKRVHRMLEQENKLIQRCDVLYASAQKLKEKVDNVAGYDKSILIRNGVKIDTIEKVKNAQIKEQYELCYIGTISEWFDYELIERSIIKNENIRYQLIGPAKRQIENDKIVYHGAKQHGELGAIIRDYDCLIMPFVINDIVTSVDPVKLYEYIAFGKCIVSVSYPEIERFGDYVHFYRTQEEYIALIEELKKQGFPPKYNFEQQRRFLAENTWERRYEAIKSEL